MGLPAGKARKSLRSNTKPTLDVPPVRRNAEESETHEMFQAHHGYLERVEFFPPQPVQNLGDAFSERSSVGAADDSGLVLASEPDEIPVGLADLPVQGVAIKILHYPPTG